MLGFLGSYAAFAPDAALAVAYPLWERWLARCVSVVVYGALFVLLASGRSVAQDRALVGAAGVSLLAGAFLTLIGSGSQTLFVVGQLLVGVGNPVILIAWGDCLADLPAAAQRNALVFAALVDSLLILLLRLVSPFAGGTMYLFVVVASFVPLLVGSSRFPAPEVRAAPPRDFPKPLFRAVPWELLLLMACYALLYRTLQHFDYSVEVLSPVVRSAVTFTAVLVLGWFWGLPGSNGSRRISLSLFGLAAVALVLVPFSDGTMRAVASAIASSCWPLFYFCLWVILLDMGAKNEFGPSVTFAAGWFILNVELILVAPVAQVLVQQVSGGTLSMTALVLMLVYTLAVASLLHRREVTWPGSSIPAGAVPSDAVRSGIEALCCEVTQRYGLTQRESDVLQLLARGRSVPFIADVLQISQSTAKGHVRHIYEKMEVANKQELLSRIEGQGQSL